MGIPLRWFFGGCFTELNSIEYIGTCGDNSFERRECFPFWFLILISGIWEKVFLGALVMFPVPCSTFPNSRGRGQLRYYGRLAGGGRLHGTDKSWEHQWDLSTGSFSLKCISGDLAVYFGTIRLFEENDAFLGKMKNTGKTLTKASTTIRKTYRQSRIKTQTVSYKFILLVVLEPPSHPYRQRYGFD